MASLMILPAIAMAVLFVWSLFWVYNDAERRGKSGCLVSLMVFFVSWPVGLLLWLVFRPERRDFW